MDGTSCECAIAVRDDWRHRGIGTRLMMHLIEVARGLGIDRMYSSDSAENTEMAELAQSLGFSRRHDPDDPTVVVDDLNLADTAAALPSRPLA